MCLKQNKYNGLYFDDAASEFFWCLATLHVFSSWQWHGSFDFWFLLHEILFYFLKKYMVKI